MGPPSYMQSIVDRNVVMRRMPVQWYLGQRVTLLTNFLANEDFFAVFRTRLTNVLVDARANIKQQTWTVGPFHELIFSVFMCVTKKWADHIT